MEQVKEQVRGIRIGSGADAVATDVRGAWRQLWKQPGFAAIVVLTLALGIGANSAIFSVVHALLVEPLPYRDANRLVFVWSNLTDGSYPRAPLSGPELNDLRERTTTLAAVGAIWPNTAALTGEGDPEQLRIGLVTANFFRAGRGCALRPDVLDGGRAARRDPVGRLELGPLAAPLRRGSCPSSGGGYGSMERR